MVSMDNLIDDIAEKMELFDKEMKYLHDNGVQVMTMSGLQSDEKQQ
jgi:hypothetical protein